MKNFEIVLHYLAGYHSCFLSALLFCRRSAIDNTKLLTLCRYPTDKLSLANLMTPAGWVWTFSSLAVVVICYCGLSLLVRRFMGMKIVNIEIDLFPFRSQYLDEDDLGSSLVFRVYFPVEHEKKGKAKARVPEQSSLQARV